MTTSWPLNRRRSSARRRSVSSPRSWNSSRIKVSNEHICSRVLSTTPGVAKRTRVEAVTRRSSRTQYPTPSPNVEDSSSATLWARLRHATRLGSTTRVFPEHQRGTWVDLPEPVGEVTTTGPSFSASTNSCRIDSMGSGGSTFSFYQSPVEDDALDPAGTLPWLSSRRRQGLWSKWTEQDNEDKEEWIHHRRDALLGGAVGSGGRTRRS